MDLLHLKEIFKNTIGYIIFITVLLFLIFYVMTLHQMKDVSMSPTIENNEITVLSKSHYRYTNVKVDDIIVFRYDNVLYTKRVKAVAGDTVKIDEYGIYVNGINIDKNYKPDTFETAFGTKVVGKNEFFLLGDNLEESLDSRKIGFIGRKQIVGKVIMRFWPITRFKTL